MQRLHEDDLTASLEKGEFEVLSLSAIATERQLVPIGESRFYERLPGEALHPDRESLETLQLTKSSIGSRTFEAQYQQSPVPARVTCSRPAGSDAIPMLRCVLSDIVQSWNCYKTRREQRLFRLHHLGHSQRNLLPHQCPPGAMEFPELLRTVPRKQNITRFKTVLIETQTPSGADPVPAADEPALAARCRIPHWSAG